jgi:hypothetical protein
MKSLKYITPEEIFNSYNKYGEDFLVIDIVNYKESSMKTVKYFDIKDRKWVSVRRGSTWDKEGNRKDRYEEMIRIPISDFDTIVLDYLGNNSKYGNSGTLEFQGSLIKIIGEEYDCLRVRFPDYSDSRKVQKNINEMFSEYIH